VLVTEVLERRNPGVLAESRQTASQLEQQLLGLVDEDAAAYRAFLDAGRDSKGRVTAGGRAVGVPLEIGRACARIIDLVNVAEPHVTGAMRLDLGAAANMARAAAQSALNIAEYNLRLVSEPSTAQILKRDVDRLRQDV
jgi:formiminotetrahydrofolate cyclodeaminase